MSKVSNDAKVEWLLSMTLTLTLTLALTPTPTLTKAPTWLDSIIAVQGLPKAVAWVKRESEKGLKRRIQSAPDLTRLVG